MSLADKILSKDSVKDLFSLFFSISSLNRVALLMVIHFQYSLLQSVMSKSEAIES